MITLYHYTTENGGLGIKKRKKIQQSTKNTPLKNRLHGEGVYFTSLEPSHDPKKLVLNNFTRSGRTLRSTTLFQKIHYVVRVTFRKEEVKKIQDGTRDIYLYRGDVDLTKYDYTVNKNPYYPK